MMIVRKHMITVRILMIVITIPDYFPFMVEPPALHSCAVYIQIDS